MLSKRKFLFEMVDDIRNTKDRAEKINEYMKTSKMFRDFFDITYNQNYQWEFDVSYKKEPRNRRSNGSTVSETKNAIKFIKRRLLKPTKESKNFMKQLDRVLELVNINDINIILCSLKNRSIKYINTGAIYKAFPEYKCDTSININTETEEDINEAAKDSDAQ